MSPAEISRADTPHSRPNVGLSPNAATSRTFRPEATRAQRKCDLGAQARPRRPNTHQTTTKDYTATLHEPRQQRLPIYWPRLTGPPSLMFVLCLCLFVCLFACLSVCLYVAVSTRDSLGHPPLNCFPWTPPSAIINVPLILNVVFATYAASKY